MLQLQLQPHLGQQQQAGRLPAWAASLPLQQLQQLHAGKGVDYTWLAG